MAEPFNEDTGTQDPRLPSFSALYCPAFQKLSSSYCPPPNQSPMQTVTVVIPCFNAGEHIDESISSVKHQEPGDFRVAEILIIDDGSTDELTISRLNELSNDPIITILQNNGKKGAAGARNTGIARAEGEWVAFLDADDWWPPDSLKLRFAALKCNPSADWVGGDFCDVASGETPDRIGRFEAAAPQYPFLAPAYKEARPLLFSDPLDQFLIATPTHTCVTLVRTEILRQEGGFSEDLLRAQDIHLWLRLAAGHAFLFVPNVLAYYRHHSNNSTRSVSHTLQWRAVAVRDLLKLDRLNKAKSLLQSQLAVTMLSLSYEHRREGSFSKAALAAARTLKHPQFRREGLRSLAASLLRIQ